MKAAKHLGVHTACDDAVRACVSGSGRWRRYFGASSSEQRRQHTDVETLHGGPSCGRHTSTPNGRHQRDAAHGRRCRRRRRRHGWRLTVVEITAVRLGRRSTVVSLDSWLRFSTGQQTRPAAEQHQRHRTMLGRRLHWCRVIGKHVTYLHCLLYSSWLSVFWIIWEALWGRIWVVCIRLENLGSVVSFSQGRPKNRFGTFWLWTVPSGASIQQIFGEVENIYRTTICYSNIYGLQSTVLEFFRDCSLLIVNIS